MAKRSSFPRRFGQLLAKRNAMVSAASTTRFLFSLESAQRAAGVTVGCVDLDAGTIEIRRTQDLDGNITGATKTSASPAGSDPSPVGGVASRMEAALSDGYDGLGRVFPTLGRTYDTGVRYAADCPSRTIISA